MQTCLCSTGQTSSRTRSSTGLVSIEKDGDADPEKLNACLGQLLRERGVDIFRMKGFISVAGESRRFIFHGVHMLFDGTAAHAGVGRYAQRRSPSPADRAPPVASVGVGYVRRGAGVQPAGRRPAGSARTSYQAPQGLTGAVSAIRHFPFDVRPWTQGLLRQPKEQALP